MRLKVVELIGAWVLRDHGGGARWHPVHFPPLPVGLDGQTEPHPISIRSGMDRAMIGQEMIRHKTASLKQTNKREGAVWNANRMFMRQPSLNKWKGFKGNWKVKNNRRELHLWQCDTYWADLDVRELNHISSVNSYPGLPGGSRVDEKSDRITGRIGIQIRIRPAGLTPRRTFGSILTGWYKMNKTVLLTNKEKKCVWGICGQQCAEKQKALPDVP